MFEAESLSRRERFVRALRAAVDLNRCVPMTRAQRLARALFWLAVGMAMTSSGIAYRDLRYPSPVTLLPPAIEQRPGFTLFTFRFEHRGAESACRLVVYHNDVHTWSVSC